MIGGAWAVPPAVQLVVAAPLAHAPILLVCLAALAVTGPLAAQLIFELAVRLLGPAIGSDRVVTRALAALATALCVAAAFVSSLPSEDRLDGGGVLSVLGGRLREVAFDGFVALDVAAILATPVLLVAALSALDRLPGPRREDGRWAPRRRWARARSRRSLVALEIVQWLRYPMNATLLLLSVAVIVSSVLVWGGRGTGDTWLTISLIFFSLLSTVGVGSCAASREAHWTYRTVARPYLWIVPKLAAALAIWLTLVGACAGVLWLLTPWAIGDLPLWSAAALHLANLAPFAADGRALLVAGAAVG